MFFSTFDAVKVRKSSIDVLFAFYYQVGGSKLHVSDPRKVLSQVCVTTQLGRCAKTFIVRKSVQVMIMSPSVTFFQKSIIIMRMRVKAYFQTQQFSIFNSFFSGNNHNQNRKSSLKLERDIKPKSEGISILRIIINRIKSVKYVSLVRFAQFWLFNQKITKLVCFAQL